MQVDTVNRLRQEAELVRASLHARRGIHGDMFQTFPAGCCGAASELLARHLREHLSMDAMYVSAEQDRHGQYWSHAWVVVGDLIVDITADQFSEIDDTVIVTAGSAWHGRWIARDAPRPPITTQKHWPAYPAQAWAAIAATHNDRLR